MVQLQVNEHFSLLEVLVHHLKIMGVPLDRARLENLSDDVKLSHFICSVCLIEMCVRLLVAFQWERTEVQCGLATHGEMLCVHLL